MTKKEVHNILPSLKVAAGLKNPFCVPSGYFDEIEARVETQIHFDKIESSSSEIFSTPSAYFETVEDRVITKLKAEALGNTDSQPVPDNYFENFEEKVLERLNIEHQEKKINVISLQNWKKIVVSIAVAASLILIFTIGNKQQKEVTFENLALSEIESALEDNFLGYNSETILEIFPELEASLADLDLEFSDHDNLESYLYEVDLSNILYE